jgi:DNA-binding MarR family transcriptional regulator
VEITREGIALFDAAHAAARPLADRLVSTLRPGEADQLREILIRFSPQPEPLDPGNNLA